MASAVHCCRFARISYCRSFSTDFYVAWRHHGFFRDDGIFLWAHELDCPPSNWGSRSGFSFLEFIWVYGSLLQGEYSLISFLSSAEILPIQAGLPLLPFLSLNLTQALGSIILIWSLQLSGLGSLLAGINFLVTIIKKRAPGMTLMKMPLFTWNSLCAMVLIISAFPVLTATTLLLWLDRAFGMHFFTTGFGGNQMMYWNLIWMWGHPEVYILVITGIWHVLRNRLYFFTKESFWICIHGMGGNYQSLLSLIWCGCTTFLSWVQVRT